MENYVIFFLYFSFLVLMGFYFSKKNKTDEDYILGGRKMGPVVMAFSAGASDMSGWLLMGLPGGMYVTGLINGWMAVALLLGSYLNWLIVAKRLRIFTYGLGNSLTLSKYLNNRFDDKSNMLSGATAIATLFFFTVYVSAGLVGGAKLFESTFGMSYMNSLFLGGGIIATYTIMGGFYAVSWSDFFQGLFMALALIITPILMIYEMISQNVSVFAEVDPKLLDITEGASVMGIVSLCAWGLGYFGQPHILSRFMAIKDVKSIPKARRISVLWTFLSMSGALSVGFLGISYVKFHGITLDDPEKIMLVVSKILYNPWIASMISIAILSAIMSTIDSQLLVSTAVLVEDFYKPFIKKDADKSHYAFIGRIGVVAVFLISLWMSTDKNSVILSMVGYAWAGFGGVLGPVIILSLFWKGITRNGALFGMIIGMITVIVWKNLKGGIFDVYELLPAFIVSTLTIVIVSLLKKEEKSELIYEKIVSENKL